MKTKSGRAEVMKGSVKFADVLKEDLKDPSFRAGFEKHLLEAEIAEHIHSLREKLQLTQRQLADRAGMKQHAVSRIEKAAHSMTLQTLQRVAGALGCRLKVSLVPA